MNKQTEALKMAIEWVEGWKGIAPSKIELLRVLREALAQPAQEPYGWEYAGAIWNDKDEVFGWHEKNKLEQNPPLPLYTHPAPQPAQEPVATIQQWEHKEGDKWIANELPWNEMPPVGTKLYTHPAPSWQGLSDDEITQLKDNWGIDIDHWNDFARAIEQELKTKNGFSDVKEKNHAL